MKKAGKLPFDPVFDIEFLDDRYVEITPTSRIEQRYEALERICVADSRFIYLYQTSVTAQILSIQQLREQVNEQEFLSFLSQRCRTVEYY